MRSLVPRHPRHALIAAAVAGFVLIAVLIGVLAFSARTCAYAEPGWRQSMRDRHPDSVGETLICVDDDGHDVKIYYNGCGFGRTGPDSFIPLGACL